MPPLAWRLRLTSSSAVCAERAAAKAAAKRILVSIESSPRRAKFPLVCHKKGAAGAVKRLLTRWGWDTTGSGFDAETRRRGERRGEETGGMEGGGFTGSTRWGAEEAEKEENVRACDDRSLARRGWDTTGGGFDAETRRRNGRDGRWRVHWFHAMGSGGSGEGRERPSFARIGRLKPAPPWTGRRAVLRRFVTQSPEGGGGSGVGARSLSALGCGDGGRFCDANRWITRTPPERRRNWTVIPASASGRMELWSWAERALGV